MKYALLALLMLLASPAALAAAAVPPDVAATQQRLAAGLSPPLREWVRQQALIVRAGPPAAAESLAANAARQRFGAQLRSPDQLNALVFLVLHEAVALEPLPPAAAPAAARAQPPLRAVPNPAPARGGSDLPEMSSMRLQLAMDRRSKLLATLSNLMKKMSTTQGTLVQNLK